MQGKGQSLGEEFLDAQYLLLVRIIMTNGLVCVSLSPGPQFLALQQKIIIHPFTLDLFHFCFLSLLFSLCSSVTLPSFLTSLPPSFPLSPPSSLLFFLYLSFSFPTIATSPPLPLCSDLSYLGKENYNIMRNTCQISGVFQFWISGELILTETANLVYSTGGTTNGNNLLKVPWQFAVHFKGAHMPACLLEKLSKEITRNVDKYLSIRMSIAMKYITTTTTKTKQKKVKRLDTQKQEVGKIMLYLQMESYVATTNPIFALQPLEIHF